MASLIPAPFLRLDHELGPHRPGLSRRPRAARRRACRCGRLGSAATATEQGSVDERANGFWWSGSAIWACPTPSPMRGSTASRSRALHAQHRRHAACRRHCRTRRASPISTRRSRAAKPDVVSINTWSDTHAPYAIRAMEAGAHVFVEKPLADTVADARARGRDGDRTKRKLVIGYILRHHPSWIKFIEIARTLGTPHVFRMNLNQQSSGAAWEAHKRLLQSPLAHRRLRRALLDVMCQITRAKPRAGAWRRRAADRGHAGRACTITAICR